MANSIYNCGCAGNGGTPVTDDGVSTCGCGNTCGCNSGSCGCSSCGNPGSIFGGENDLLTLIASVLLVVSLLWGRN